LHRSTARALWRQQDVGLTTTEYKILARLVSHTGEPQTYRALYDVAHYAGLSPAAVSAGTTQMSAR